MPRARGRRDAGRAARPLDRRARRRAGRAPRLTARLLLRGLFEDDELTGEPLPEARRADATMLAGRRRGIDGAAARRHAAGAFREVTVRHMVQTLIGATVYHFASGEFGEALLGRPLLSAEAVRRARRSFEIFCTMGSRRYRRSLKAGRRS